VTRLNFETPLRSFVPSCVPKDGFTRSREAAKKKAFLLACTLALVPMSAFAQERDQDGNIDIGEVQFTGPRINPDIVVTASGFAQPRVETGQAISVIDQDRLDTLQVTTIADAIAALPGVRVATRGSVGGQSSAFIRGGNSSQTLVLIDGVRINDPSSPNGQFDFGALLTGNVERVEVLRGPNSIIWGSQAIGGVVNIQSATPTQDFAATASAEYGRYDTAQARANISGTSGILEGSVGGTYFTTGGISSLRSGTERDGYRNYAANGRLKVNVSDSFSLDFRGYYNRGRVEYDSPFGAGGDAVPISRNKQFVGYVGANLSLLDDRLKSRISYARTDITRVGSDPVVFSFNTFDVKGNVDRFELHNSFAVADAVTLVFGAEHERIYASTSFEGFAPDIASNKVTSGFAQAIVRPFAGLSVTGGIRHDDYTTYGGQTTLGGNIAYTPNEGRTVLRATYGEGFRAPTLSEGQPPFGNPNLKPETARNFDLGAEQGFLNGKARFGITYFNRRSTDLIVGNPANFFTPENIQRAKSEGVELELFLKPTATLDVRANYSLVNARIKSPGTQFNNRLALRPRDSANVSIDWQTPWKAAIGASLSLTGDSFDNLANTVRLDGYVLAGLRAAVPLGDRFEIYGRVENLFDTKYEIVRSFGTYGRNAHIGVRAKF
jgi:vitamin B12 transporter